jgi:hypothetical protein
MRCGYAFYAAGLGLVTPGTVEGPGLVIAIGAVVFNVAPALFRMSSRLFDRRRVPLALLFASASPAKAMKARNRVDRRRTGRDSGRGPFLEVGA